MTALQKKNIKSSRKEIPLLEDEYQRIYQLIKKNFGIDLHPAKKDLITSRLNKRLNSLGIESYGAYVNYLMDHWDAEVETFANAITTNLTSFFRESHHFEYLEDTIIPNLVENIRRQKRLRIWSSACSTGEEAYSMAMVFYHNRETLGCHDIKLLATDLDTNVLKTAYAGVYGSERLASVPEKYLADSVTQIDDKLFEVNTALKKMISFRRLNFFTLWPLKGNFDLIMCRNALIYFDEEAQRTVIEKFSHHQSSGDYLILGHSESAEQVSDKYELVGKTIYRKI